MSGDPKNKADRGLKAFTGPGGNPPGEVSAQNCADAGLHDPVTWGKVKNITVRDLMTLSYFHERTPPRGKVPDLDSPEGAAIISALQLHTEMNYHHMEGGGHGFEACCTCIA